MSKSEFNFSTEGSQISDHKNEFKSPKIKSAKIADLNKKTIVQWCYKNTPTRKYSNLIYYVISIF